MDCLILPTPEVQYKLEDIVGVYRTPSGERVMFFSQPDPIGLNPTGGYTLSDVIPPDQIRSAVIVIGQHRVVYKTFPRPHPTSGKFRTNRDPLLNMTLPDPTRYAVVDRTRT